MRRLSYFLMFVLLAAAVPGMLSAAPRPGEPQVEITSPPADAIIDGSEYQVVVQFASTDKLPVDKVQVYLDGKFITSRTYDKAMVEGASSFKWDTTRTSNGRHKLDIQVFSGEEYLGMNSCTVYVSNKAKDIIPPRVAVTSPKNGEVVSGIVPIVIEAADNSGMDPMVNVYVDRSLRSVRNRGPYEYAWDTTGVENGPHTIEVNAEDDSRNIAPTATIRVTVKNGLAQAPRTFTAPISPSNDNVALPVAGKPAPGDAARSTRSSAESFVAGPVPVAKPAPVRKTEPKLTLMAKADTTPLQVPQCCPGSVCDVAEPVAGPEPERAPAVEENVYVVREGDNLDTLAKRFGVTVKGIVELNDIKDPAMLQIGWKLRIPAPVRLIPVRPVFEAAGGTLIWESGKPTVVRAVCPQKDVLLQVGSAKAMVNKKSVKMDAATVVNSGRTMVPESFVTGPLGMVIPGK